MAGGLVDAIRIGSHVRFAVARGMCVMAGIVIGVERGPDGTPLGAVVELYDGETVYYDGHAALIGGGWLRVGPMTTA